MEESLKITVLIAETVVAGISAQVLASYLQIPSIVLLLLFGMILGSDGFVFLHPSLLGNGLEVLVSLLVALILFEGGLNLQLRELGKVSSSLRNLVTIGVLITLIR
jgi:NhaP-type Na+/H+ or K+/H+ antiporter